MTERIMIVNDADGRWRVRHVFSVGYDMDRDLKVYRCDWPIDWTFEKLDDAVEVAKNYLADGEHNTGMAKIRLGYEEASGDGEPESKS